MSRSFLTGLDVLATQPDALRGRRVALLAHPASIDRTGRHAADILHEQLGDSLKMLLGPEHGYFGGGLAGDHIADDLHPGYGLPVHSLYGQRRRPDAELLAPVDTVVFDLQDLAVRCYTFLSTLRYVMEACAEQGKALWVLDRPVPFPHSIDGPLLEPAHGSFVGCAPVPLVHGLTPGEAARFLQQELGLSLDLHVVPLQGYRRSPTRGAGWGPWISPSPAIRTWETAWTYPALVGFEALGGFYYGRGSILPFEVVSAPFLEPVSLARELNAEQLPGLAFHPHWLPQPAVRLAVTHPRTLQAVTAGVALLDLLQRRHGREAVWGHADTRPAFFDQLMGTSSVREGLQAGQSWRDLAASWTRSHRTFAAARRSILLYA